MTLVVETGSGSATANSYATVEDANEYVSLRRLTGWGTLTTQAREAALVAATDYLEEVYASLWQGQRVSQDQALSWPREYVVAHGFPVASNVVPGPVSKACIILAVKVAQGQVLLEDQGQRVIREKIDVIETEYSEFSDPRTRYLQVDHSLTPYLEGGSASDSFKQIRVRRT